MGKLLLLGCGWSDGPTGPPVAGSYFGGSYFGHRFFGQRFFG